KQGWKEGTFEFVIQQISLLESVKENLTKKVELKLDIQNLTKERIDFITNNIIQNPGNATIKFRIKDEYEKMDLNLSHGTKGFTMNNDMAEFLLSNADVEVKVNSN
ncbi:MAG TPA: hypothetical protein PLU36_10110, partial [Chitinophagaceae bacterium]|nr:hypothetical protein [Chitinophagaceae bacterium]